MITIIICRVYFAFTNVGHATVITMVYPVLESKAANIDLPEDRILSKSLDATASTQIEVKQ